MDNFTYFHLCDHRIKRPFNTGIVNTFAVDSNDQQIQTLVNGAAVLSISEVRVLEYDPIAEIVDLVYDNPDDEQTYEDVRPGEAYYDNKVQFLVDYSKYFQDGQAVSDPLPVEFYAPFLHNRIEWTVKPPKKYQVTAELRFSGDNYITYRGTECPVCNGLGWFIDILGKNGDFSQPVGIGKVAQRVVKDFLTELGTLQLDTSYGTTVKQDALNASKDDDTLFNTIRVAVSQVEDNYLTDQQNMITQLSQEETLRSLSVEDVSRSLQDPTIIIIRLKITTVLDQQIFQLGFGL
jgi:hypothetical protein